MGIEYQRNANGDFVCQFCGKVVPKEKQNTMHYHLKKHSGDLPHECGTCGKKFAQKQSLDLHIQWNHEKDTQIFECPVKGCGFTATTWANRRIHFLRKHCKEEINAIHDENHRCKACHKTFNSSTAFFYHAGDCINGTQIAYFQGVI
jgi:hypothetical protein